MDELYRHCALADSRSDALDRPGPYIARGEHAPPAGFEQKGVAGDVPVGDRPRIGPVRTKALASFSIWPDLTTKTLQSHSPTLNSFSPALYFLSTVNGQLPSEAISASLSARNATRCKSYFCMANPEFNAKLLSHSRKYGAARGGTGNSTSST
jgi:hypothetical protein